MSIQDIVETVRNAFNKASKALSDEDYCEALREIISDFEISLEAKESEMEE